MAGVHGWRVEVSLDAGRDVGADPGADRVVGGNVMIIGLVVCVCIAASVFVWNLLHTLPRTRLSSPFRVCTNCGKRIRPQAGAGWIHVGNPTALCGVKAARHD